MDGNAILGVIALLIIAGGAYFLIKKFREDPPQL